MNAHCVQVWRKKYEQASWEGNRSDRNLHQVHQLGGLILISNILTARFNKLNIVWGKAKWMQVFYVAAVDANISMRVIYGLPAGV